MTTRKRFTEESYHKEPWFRALCDALLSCNTEQQMSEMLRDIGTLSELQAWAERLEVAKHLAKGLSYREIASITGASTTTVTRVAKFIENGPGGYRRYLKVHRHHRMGADVQSHHNQSGSSTRGTEASGAGESVNGLQEDQKSNVQSSSHNLAESNNGQKQTSVLQKYLDRK